MIFGVSTTKSAVVIAETKGTGSKFVIARIRSISFDVGSGAELTELLKTLAAIFAPRGRSTRPTIALLKCSSGRFGSGLEAIKRETMAELAAFQTGLEVVKIAPQSLKKSLKCAREQKWRDRATELFNPDGRRPNWSKAAAGAVSVAFKVAA